MPETIVCSLSVNRAECKSDLEVKELSLSIICSVSILVDMAMSRHLMAAAGVFALRQASPSISTIAWAPSCVHPSVAGAVRPGADCWGWRSASQRGSASSASGRRTRVVKLEF